MTKKEGFAVSYRVYASAEDHQKLTKLSDAIADLICEHGFNQGDESIDVAAITTVTKSEDVEAWAKGPEPFFDAISGKVIECVIPNGREILDKEEEDDTA